MSAPSPEPMPMPPRRDDSAADMDSLVEMGQAEPQPEPSDPQPTEPAPDQPA